MKYKFTAIALLISTVFLHGCDVGASRANSAGSELGAPNPVSTGIKELTHFKVSNTGDAHSPQISKDGKYLFIADVRYIKTFKLESGLDSAIQIASKKEDDWQEDIVLTPDNRYLFSATQTGWINKYKVNPNGSLTYAGHYANSAHNVESYSGRNYAIATSYDGKYLFISGQYCTSTGASNCVDFSSKDKKGWELSVWVFRIDDGINFTGIQRSRLYTSVPTSLVFSRDKYFIYSATNTINDNIKAFIFDNGKVDKNNELKSYSTKYSAMTISQDGKNLYAAAANKKIITYSILPSGELDEKSRTDNIDADLNGMTVDASGLYLVGTDGTNLRVYDLNS